MPAKLLAVDRGVVLSLHDRCVVIVDRRGEDEIVLPLGSWPARDEGWSAWHRIAQLSAVRRRLVAGVVQTPIGVGKRS